MGCMPSKRLSDQAQQISLQIDKQIYRDKQNQMNEIKMLLLGAGESGKSTIVKQIKLIHQGTFTTQERESYKQLIISNIIQTIQAILKAMETLQIELQDESLGPSATFIQTLSIYPSSLEGQELSVIQSLWHDPGLQLCFERRREFQLGDSTEYYIEALERIGQPSYLPTDQDILHARSKTRGISETCLPIGLLHYRLLDVGGQRSERKKWIHCFEQVTVIVFVAAISEYDQVLREDEFANRMVEAMQLFDSICNSRWFAKTSMILFLNKIDIFKLKLNSSPIQNFFPDFKPPAIHSLQHDHHQLLFQAGAEFFKTKFLNLNQKPSKQLYVHLTCATDTSQIRHVLAHVNDIIIQLNLSDYGMM